MQTYWLWLAARPHLKDRDKMALLERFPSAEDIFYAGEEEFEALSPEARESLLDKDLTQAKKIEEDCANKQITLITWQDTAYPARLRLIPDPPLVLYCKGTLPDFEKKPAIGVVGTRKASGYGISTAMRMAFQIACCGGIVVSGMARGIDTAATEGALLAQKETVGVLGCGVDKVYPAGSRELHAQVSWKGCLISEYPPGTPPYKWNFPRRNRIISGLSQGVLVVEAPVKSGALITARQALEQGRDVFVVPGNIDVASCEGSNALLRDGAIMASSGWDVVSEYEALFPGAVKKDTTPFPGRKAPPQVAQTVECPQSADKKDVDKGPKPPYIDVDKKQMPLTPDEQTLMDKLTGEEQNMDDVIAGSGLAAGAALAALTLLQIKGRVALLPGKRVRKL